MGIGSWTPARFSACPILALCRRHPPNFQPPEPVNFASHRVDCPRPKPPSPSTSYRRVAAPSSTPPGTNQAPSRHRRRRPSTSSLAWTASMCSLPCCLTFCQRMQRRGWTRACLLACSPCVRTCSACVAPANAHDACVPAFLYVYASVMRVCVAVCVWYRWPECVHAVLCSLLIYVLVLLLYVHAIQMKFLLIFWHVELVLSVFWGGECKAVY